MTPLNREGVMEGVMEGSTTEVCREYKHEVMAMLDVLGVMVRRITAELGSEANGLGAGDGSCSTPSRRKRFRCR